MTTSANPALVGLILLLLLLVIAATCRPGPSSERYITGTSPAEDAMAGGAS